VLRTCLGEHTRAAAILHGVLSDGGEGQAEALATLEAMFAAGEALETVSELLDGNYRSRGDLPRLAHVLEVRLGTAEDTDERLQLVDELLALYGGELPDPARAFDTLCMRFELAPEDRGTWDDLEKLAGETQLWEALASRWQLVLDGQGHGPGYENVSDATQLRVRLASLVHHRLGRPDEAVEVYERVLADADDLAGQYDVLEALEAIYVERDAPEDVVRIRMLTSESHMDGAVRRSKLLDACSVLAERLERPEEALAHYERLVTENPADDEFADRYENTLQDLERWETLIDHLERRAEALGTDDATDRLDFRRAMVQLRRLGDLTAALESLLVLVPSQAIGSQVHDVLRELAVDPMTTDETRSRIVAKLTEHFHVHEDRLGRAALLEVKSQFATPGMNRAHLLLEAAGLVVAEAGEIEEDGLHLRLRAFGLYADALREVPTSAVTLSALDDLVENLDRWEIYADLMAEVSDACSEPAVATGMRRRAAHAIEVHLEDVERAIICWESVINTDRKHSGSHRKEALAALDRLYGQTDRRSERVKVLQQRVELTDRVMERVEMLRDAARLLHDLGRNDEAISTLQGLVREARATRRKDLIAARTQALEHLDLLLTETKRHEELVGLLVENAEESRDPDQARLELYRAAEIAEGRMHRPALAVEIFEKVRALDRFDEIALERLDKLYTTCGQWEEKIAVLEDRIELARRAEDEPALRDLWFTLGQLRENRLHDSVSAVEAYAACLATDPEFAPAIAALQLGASEAAAGCRSREVLSFAYRNTQAWAELASCLESRITHGDAASAPGGFEAELASLYLDKLDSVAEAWPHAAAAYRAQPGDAEGGRRRELLARSAEAESLAEDLADLLLDVGRTIPSDTARLTRHRDDIELLAGRGAGDLALAPIWKEILTLDPSSADALSALERVARGTKDTRKLVDVLRRRADHAGDEAQARSLRVEVAQILANASGEEDEAIGLFHALLVDAPEDLQVFEQLATLYRRMERWDDLSELLRSQLKRTPEADEAAHWHRELALLSWQVFEDGARAVSHARSTLATLEDDSAVVSLLETLGGTGSEPQAVLELLEPVYKRAGDDSRLADLYRKTLERDSRPPVKRSVLPRLIALEMGPLEDPERAYESAKALVKVSQDRDEHLDRLEALASDTERWPDLVDFLESLLGHEPADVPLIRRTGALAMTQLDDMDRAMVHERAILAIDPSDAQARDAITIILTDAERWEDLVEHLRTIAEGPEDGATRRDALLMAAEVLDEHLERMGDAASLLQSAVALDPKDDDISERLASTLETLGDRDRLHVHYRSWIKESPGDISFALHLRLATSLLQRPDSAASGVDEIRALLEGSEPEVGARELLDGFLADPDHRGDSWRRSVEAGIALIESLSGESQTAAERAELAEIRLRTLDRADDEAREARRTAAQQREAAGDIEGALAHYSHLLADAPEDEELAEELAAVADRHDRWEDLASILSQSVTDGVAHGTRVDRMARIARVHLDKLKDPASAISWYERLLESEPTHVEAFECLTKHYREGGQAQDEARVLDQWRRSVGEDPSGALQRRLAALHMDELGQPETALALLEEDLGAVVADEDLFARGERLYAHFERYEDLAELYRLALELDDASASDRVDLLARLTQVAETQLEDDDLTRESALSVIALEPTHAYAMGSLERVARKTGQWQDLDRAFDLQLEVTHDDDARAALLLSRGETAIRRLGDPLGALACALEANDLIGSEDAADRLVPLLEALLEAQESRLDAARTLEPLFAHAKRWTDQISVVRIRLDAATEPGAAEDLARHLAGLAEDRLEDPMTALGVLLDTLGRFPSRIGMRSAIDRLAADTAGYRRVAKTLEEITPRLEDDTRLAGELWLGTIRHENLGDDSGATKALESVVRQEPAHRRALALLAKIYERMQKWDALVTTYERLARVTGPDSERARVHMQHAEVLESRLEALDRARGVCEEALTADGTNVDALAMLERIARHRQDFGGLDQALGRRIEATSADRDKVALLLQRADNLLANLDGSTEALALLEQAQDHAGTKRDRARIASLYEVLLDRETTRPVAARHLAEHYETTRRWSELVSALEILQAHASDDGERREIGLRLATVCEHRIGDAPAALGTLLGLLEGTETPMTVAPEIDRLAKDTDAWGVVADRLDDLVGESRQAQRVELARWLGRIHLDRLDDVDQAISAYERVLALDDGHRETLELLEALYEETGDGAALMRILSARVASTDGLGERVGLLMKKARVAEDELGDLEAARQACEAILALEPGHLDALEALERFAGTRRDWKDMDRVLTSRFEASSDASERLHLMLSRARNLLQHLDGAAEALDLTIAADDAARSGDETGEVVATLELLLAVEPTAERAATRLVPHYEGARRWSDLVATVEILGSHATSSDEREALALRASKLAETQLGDGGRGLDILLGALEREPANLNLRQEISRMAERVDAWGRVSEVVGPLLTHGLNPTLTVELGLWLARIRREHLDSPEGAADALERVLAVDAVHGEALNGLDEIYRATGRDDRLRTLLDARLAVVSDAERPTILEELADVTYRCEGPAASLNVWRQLIWERPDHEEARERIAGMLGSPDTMNDAASILEPIFRREADWPMLAHVLECKLEASTDSREGLSIRSQVAEIYERRIEDPNRAFEHLVEVFAEQPSRIELRDRLCSLAESAGMWDRLAQALERAVSTVTEERLRVGHLLALAPILEDRREDAEGAITALERVLVIESREPTALAGLRRLYGVTGHDAGSLDATFRLAEITTDGAKAEALYREALGLAILLEETSIEARACEAILVQAPEDDAVAARLAERYEESEQYEALADLLSDRVEGSDDPKEVARRHQRLAQLRYDKLLDVEGALPHYAEAWDRDEGRLDAFEALEAAYRERRNWSELYGLLSERATRLGSDPAAAGVWLELASISERQLDDVPEAISAYESALKVDGKSEVALDSLIRLYHRHERHRELARCYQAKAEITAARAEKLDLLALAANLLAGRLEEDDAARSLIDEVLAAEVQHALGNMVRARLLARAGEPEEAAKVLETVRIHLEGGEEVEALVLLGRLYREELNRPEDALERLTLAQKLAPQHPDLAVALRELYEKTGAWSELSQCMENEYDAAEDAIERCARALGLARLYLDHLGNEKAFLLWIDRAREARSDSVEAAEALIDFHTSKEEWTQVAPHLEWLVNYLEGKRLVRDLPLRAHDLARIFERLGQGEDALQYYKMAMNADGAYLENLIEYGRLLVEMGRWDRALRVYQSLLMQQQSLPNASTLSDMLHNLAWTCHELGMTGQAQQHVKRLLELDPDHAPGLALRTRLV
jgi:tetratricopeptide (TPR) repeat protein